MVDSDHKLIIKFGAPIYIVDYDKIKFFAFILCCLLIVDLLYCLKLFVSAWQIRNHLGYFINMISNGEGNTLPNLQLAPVIFFTLINMTMLVVLYFIFDERKSPLFNIFTSLMVLLTVALLIILFALIISVIAHAYKKHESLHDGIVTAMANYSTNVKYKYQIDHLQVEFQCCGSKKYDEWYTIKWYDSSLEEGGSGSLADGNTPFSCCSMTSLFPCIHHNIEITGKAYLYTPEYNLSISTRGCYDMIREKKKNVGWSIVGNLFLLMVLEICTLIIFRFLQTGHHEHGRFVGRAKKYTIWLFGCYKGKVKKDAPEVPLIPTELKK